MKATYLVAGLSTPLVPAKGIVGGEEVEVLVQEVEVQLVDESGKWGSHTLHFRTTEEKAYALAKFVPGTTVDIEV